MEQLRKLLESEKLTRQIAEANLIDLEKAKLLLAEECKQLVNRHKKVCFSNNTLRMFIFSGIGTKRTTN